MKLSEKMFEQNIEFKAMGSPCAFHVFHEDYQNLNNAVSLAKQEVQRLEKKYSRYLTDSVLSNINQSAGKGLIQVDSETSGLLNYARMCFEQSKGVFDITSGVFRSIWTFKCKEHPIVPTENSIKHTLEYVGFDKLHWDGETISLPLGMEIDFGGIVKEYAADRAKQIFLQQGIENGLVDLGGDMAFMGPKPNNQPWLVGIRHAEKNKEAICTLQVSSGAIATSGYYERYFMFEGKRYGHMVNAKTGWPVTEVASVSVLSESCLVCGSMASIAMLKQAEGLSWLQQEKAAFVLQDQTGKVFDSYSALHGQSHLKTA